MGGEMDEYTTTPKFAGRGASQVVQWLRIWLPMQKVQETHVQFLGWEDPLEEEIATHANILAWKISRTEQSDRL